MKLGDESGLCGCHDSTFDDGVCLGHCISTECTVLVFFGLDGLDNLEGKKGHVYAFFLMLHEMWLNT